MKAIRNFSRGVRNTPHSTFRRSDDDEQKAAVPPAPPLPVTDSEISDVPNSGRRMVNQSGNVVPRMRLFRRAQQDVAQAFARTYFPPQIQERSAGDECPKTGPPTDHGIMIDSLGKLDHIARQPHLPRAPTRRRPNASESAMDSSKPLKNRPAWNSSMKTEHRSALTSPTATGVRPRCISPGAAPAEKISPPPGLKTRAPVFGRQRKRDSLPRVPTNLTNASRNPRQLRSLSVPQQTPIQSLTTRRRPPSHVVSPRQNSRPGVQRTHPPPMQPPLPQQAGCTTQSGAPGISPTAVNEKESKQRGKKLINGLLSPEIPSPKPRHPRGVEEKLSSPKKMELPAESSLSIEERIRDIQETAEVGEMKMPCPELEKQDAVEKKVADGAESSSVDISSLVDHVVYFACKEDSIEPLVTAEPPICLPDDCHSLHDPSTLGHVIAEVVRDIGKQGSSMSPPQNEPVLVERGFPQNTNELVCQVELPSTHHEIPENANASKERERKQHLAVSCHVDLGDRKSFSHNGTHQEVGGDPRETSPSTLHEATVEPAHESKVTENKTRHDDGEARIAYQHKAVVAEASTESCTVERDFTLPPSGGPIHEPESFEALEALGDNQIDTLESACGLHEEIPACEVETQCPFEYHEPVAWPHAQHKACSSIKEKVPSYGPTEEVVIKSNKEKAQPGHITPQPQEMEEPDVWPSLDPTDVSFTFTNPTTDALHHQPVPINRKSSMDSSIEDSLVSLKSEPCISVEEFPATAVEIIQEQLVRQELGEDNDVRCEWLPNEETEEVERTIKREDDFVKEEKVESDQTIEELLKKDLKDMSRSIDDEEREKEKGGEDLVNEDVEDGYRAIKEEPEDQKLATEEVKEKKRNCVIRDVGEKEGDKTVEEFVDVEESQATQSQASTPQQDMCQQSLHGDSAVIVTSAINPEPQEDGKTFKGPKAVDFAEYALEQLSSPFTYDEEIDFRDRLRGSDSPPADFPIELMPPVSPLFQDPNATLYHPDSFRFRIEPAEPIETPGEPKYEKLSPSQAPSLSGSNYIKRRQLVLMDPGAYKHCKRQPNAVILETQQCKKPSDCDDDDSLPSSHTENITVQLSQLKDSLFSLNYRYNALGIVTKEYASELKQTYREFISAARDLVTRKREYLTQSQQTEVQEALNYAVEQYIDIVDNKVVCQNWLSAWDKGGLLRLKADFLRYLAEADRKNEEKRRRCHEAYKNARLFFLENEMTNKAEWVYLQMNYASFLYLTGSRGAAQFLSRKIATSLVAKRCGKEIRDRLHSNLILYSKNL